VIYLGDCGEILKTLADNSVDAIVTDPPYGISFMNKHWDYSIPSVDIWKECLRVLKPGGHMLVACGTRTQHRMAVNIEDAGFDIRDVITWLYGSGFPKSLDVSKAIDKAAGAEREVIGPGKRHASKEFGGEKYGEFAGGIPPITTPATEAAKQWSGWGTALKPACEFWTLARKTLSEKTVAANVLKWGTGGINIDGCRVGVSKEDPNHRRATGENGGAESIFGVGNSTRPATLQQGRFPANLILDEEAGAMLGEPSRFFYCAKASKSERNAGLGDEVKQKQGARPNSADSTGKFPDHDHRETGGNNHVSCIE